MGSIRCHRHSAVVCDFLGMFGAADRGCFGWGGGLKALVQP